MFWHEGEYGEGEEWQVLLKTTNGQYSQLEELLLADHLWDNPEIRAAAIVRGSAAYLDWLNKTTARR